MEVQVDWCKKYMWSWEVSTQCGEIYILHQCTCNLSITILCLFYFGMADMCCTKFFEVLLCVGELCVHYRILLCVQVVILSANYRLLYYLEMMTFLQSLMNRMNPFSIICVVGELTWLYCSVKCQRYHFCDLKCNFASTILLALFEWQIGYPACAMQSHVWAVFSSSFL